MKSEDFMLSKTGFRVFMLRKNKMRILMLRKNRDEDLDTWQD